MAPALSTLMVCFRETFDKCVKHTVAHGHPVEFRLIVFRPFKGEIIMGRITGASDAGLKSSLFDNLEIGLAADPKTVSLEFFDDIWVPKHLMFPPDCRLYVSVLYTSQCCPSSALLCIKLWEILCPKTFSNFVS